MLIHQVIFYISFQGEGIDSIHMLTFVFYFGSNLWLIQIMAGFFCGNLINFETQLHFKCLLRAAALSSAFNVVYFNVSSKNLN